MHTPVLETEYEERHGTSVYDALRQVFAVPRLGHTGELPRARRSRQTGIQAMYPKAQAAASLTVGSNSSNHRTECMSDAQNRPRLQAHHQRLKGAGNDNGLSASLGKEEGPLSKLDFDGGACAKGGECFATARKTNAAAFL